MVSLNEKMKISHLFSADEKKLSALILCLFVMIGVAGYSYINTGDISDRLKNLLETLIFAVTTMNITSEVKEAYTNKIKKDDENVR